MSVLEETDQKKYERIGKENKEYLRLFEASLQKLSKETIQRHVSNIDLFLNDFLMERELKDMQEGIFEICSFIDEFMICKCTSSPSSIRSMSASIKKFYKCMKENGYVSEMNYDDLCEVIKEYIDEWIDDCRAYNSGDWKTYYGYDEEEGY